MKKGLKIFIFIIFTLFISTNAPLIAGQISTPVVIKSVRAGHILVNTKGEADLIKSKIDNGGNFETLARKYSNCPSAESGGDLGYFERGQMVKEFEDTAFELPVGEVSNSVKTVFGWHLIKVYDKKCE